MKKVSDELWKELEELLNRVANEREQDDDGLGSMPTTNATLAQIMLDKLEMKKSKPAHII